MRVVILSWYPTYPHREVLNLKNATAQHPMSWVTNLAVALNKYEDCEVHIVSFNTELHKSAIVQTEHFSIHFIKPLQRPFLRRLMFYYFDKIKLRILINKLRPDIVHGQGVDFPSSQAHTFDIPSVITIHGLPHEFINAAKSTAKRLKLFIKDIEKRITLRKNKNIIIISSHVQQHLSDLKGTYKISCIRNPVSEIYFSCKPSYDTQSFIFIGVDAERKGLTILLKAMIRVPTARLIVVSKDGEKLIKRFIVANKNISCGLSERIEIIKFATPEELVLLFSRSIALILPSKVETLPMVIAEASAAGIPSIATNVGGIPDMIDDFVSGYLIEPENLTKLSERMEQLLQNDKMVKEFGNMARQKAKTQYHPKEVARSTKLFYDTIINKTN